MNVNKPKRPPKPTSWMVYADIPVEFNPEDNHQIWNKLAIQLAQNMLKDGMFSKTIESYPDKPNKFILSYKIEPTYIMGIDPYYDLYPSYIKPKLSTNEKITYIDNVID